MGFEVEPYFLWLPVDSTAADEDGNHGEQLARLPALPIYEVISGIWNLDREQFKISLLGGMSQPKSYHSGKLAWKIQLTVTTHHYKIPKDYRTCCPSLRSSMMPRFTKQPVLLCVVAIRVSDKGKHI